MRPRSTIVGVLLAAATWGSVTGAQQDDVLGRAMRDELARSMKELRLSDLARPYYIAYRVSDLRSTSASASYGSLLNSTEDRARMLSVEVRVGDYTFDNTNFEGMSGGLIALGVGGIAFGFEGGDLPLDDDYLAIRRRIWLATDRAYKQAAEQYSAKKAALLNRARADTLPDFTREAPTQTIDERNAEPVPRAAAESLARALSSEPSLAHSSTSSVSISSTEAITRFMNSEGTTYTNVRPLITVSVSASTQAADGQPIAASARVYVPTASGLPNRDQLRQLVAGLGLRVDSLRTAALAERYSGPVLLEGRAAAELFSTVFAPALAARRRPQTGEQGMGMMFGAMGSSRGSFSDKVGGRVLPELLTVVDDPTMDRYGDQLLLGTYKVDEDGVPGRRKTLVDAGILRSLLSTRNPVEGMPRSSGSDRGGGPAPSNMFVESSAGETDSELRARLLALAKKRGLAYGIIVREIGATAAFTPDDPMAMMAAMQDGAAGGGGGRAVLRAYKLYSDGHEELVRGARLSDVTAQSFKDVVAVSSTRTVLHRGAGGEESESFLFEQMGVDAGGAGGMASYVVPSLLFDDLTVAKPVAQTPKPPLSAPPGRAP